MLAAVEAGERWDREFSKDEHVRFKLAQEDALRVELSQTRAELVNMKTRLDMAHEKREYSTMASLATIILQMEATIANLERNLNV